MNETLILADKILELCARLGCQSSFADFFGVNYNKWTEVRLHAYVMR